MTQEQANVAGGLFGGGGEMGALMRMLDWSATPIGSIENWPQSLRTVVSVCLSSRFPIVIYWGSEYVALYNDAYSEILGSRHPYALGTCCCDERWAEIWDAISPILDRVVATGNATELNDLLLLLERHGYLEECYFSFSFSAVRDETGKVGGIFTAATETTERVLDRRRLRTLRDLAVRSSEAKTLEAACSIIAETLGNNPADIPFALLYVLDDAGQQAHLRGSAGLKPGTPMSPQFVDLAKENDGVGTWPLARAVHTRSAQQVDNLAARFGFPPNSTELGFPHSALVLPILQANQKQPMGLLVVGINPNRLLDEDYRGFFELIASHVATAIANARAYPSQVGLSVDFRDITDRQRAQQRQRTQYAIAGVLAEATTLAEAVPSFLQSLCESLEWQLGAIWSVDTQRHVLRHLNSWHAPTVNVEEFEQVNQYTTFPPGVGLPGRIWASGQPAWISDLIEDDNFPRAAVAARGGLHAAFGFPIRLGNEILGVIECFSDKIQEPDEDLLQMMAAIGSQIGQFMERKRTEEVLRETQESFECFMSNSPAGAYIKDDAGCYIYVNPLVERHFNRKLADWIGKTDFDLMPAEIAQQWRENDSIVLDSNQTLETMETVPGLDGEHYAISFKFPFQKASGRRFLAGMSVDITDRIRTEQALRESEEKYRSIFESAGVSIWEEDFTQIKSSLDELKAQGIANLREYLKAHPDFVQKAIALVQIRDVNQQTLKLFGARTKAELLSSLDKIFVPETTQVFLEEMVALAEGCRYFESETVLQTLQGERRHVLFTIAFPEQEAGYECVLVSILDISDRKRAEEALRQSEQRYRSLVTASSQIVWRANERGQFVEIQGWEKFTGQPVEELLIQGSREAIHPDDLEWVTQAWWHAIATKSIYDVEHRIRKHDGTYEYFAVRGVPMFDAKGEVSAWVGMTTNINDRKHVESEREQLLKHERQYANKLRGLTSAALAINSELSIEEVLNVITEQAREIIGAHQSVTSMTVDQNWKQAIACFSLSDKYAAWRSYDEKSDGSGIYAFACELNQPMRMTQAELEAHPHWRGFGKEAGKHPPMRGWLSAPLVGRDGSNMGLIQLSDKYVGEFTEQDEAIVVQLAQMASVAIENARLYEASVQARSSAEAAVEALSISEARFRMMADGAPVFIWMSGLDGHCTYFNQPWLDFVGQSLEEALRIGWPEGIHPDDKEHCLNTYMTAFNARDRFHIEYRHRRKDGEYRWLLDEGVPLFNSEGSFLGYIGSGIDITERKRAEQAQQYLVEASQVFSSSLDYETTLGSIARLTVPQLADWCTVHLVEEDGSVQPLATAHVNPAKVVWANEIDQKYPFDPNAPRGIARVLRTGRSEFYPDIPDCLLVEAARDAEHLQILREAGFKSVMIVPMLVGGRVLGTISFIAAESGRRYDQADLALAEELTRRAALAIENARLYRQAQQARYKAEQAADRTARLQAVTAAFSEALTPAQVASVVVNQGIAALEVRASFVVLLSDDETFLEIVESVGLPQEVIDSWRRFPVTADVPTAETVRTGQPIFFESVEAFVTQYPILAHVPAMTENKAFACIPLTVEGRTLGAMSFSFAGSREFSEEDRAFMLTLGQQCAQAIARARLYEAEQRARAASEAARAEAEAANRIKDEFLAVLSHELRSPLNLILGWTKLLRSRQFDREGTDRALETIERNAKLQTQLIEDLLDVSRILRGKLVLDVSPVNLVFTIEAALETVRLAAQAKGIQIQTGFDADAVMVWGDPNRLQQVLWNLLSNAVKFNSPGGRVEVHLSVVSDPSLPITERYAQIQVKDTGKGIAKEFLPYVFEHFRQENSTTTRKFGGLGLGLAIVRYLVELHGGTVFAESPGKELGATFTVRLPLMVDYPDVTEEDVQSDGSADLSGLRLLVVDDEADIRELVAFILEQSGAEVSVASSASEALALLNQSAPDVLLSDIGMPDVDGYMLMRQVRTLSPERGGQIPAIALTAYAGEYNQQQALAAGFQLHIPKPVEPDELVKAIASLLH